MPRPSSRAPVPWVLVALATTTACCKPGKFGPSDHDTPRPVATSTAAGRGASTATAATATAPAAHPTATASPAGKGKAKSIHLTMGIPTDADPSDDLLLIRPQYTLSYNKVRNDPNWVSWNLDASYFGDAPRFSGKFIPDEQLPAGVYRVRHEDYSNSGYDRGHMVRSEERTKNDADNQSTFYTTNLLPQYHDLNAGPWLRLEEYCQALSQKQNKELFITAGGVFSAHPSTIGKGVAVPDSTFKIVVVLDRGQGLESVSERTRVIAVNMPNKKGIISEGWGQYRTTVDELEKLTGYDFLPDVAEAIQRVIEAKIDAGPTN